MTGFGMISTDGPAATVRFERRYPVAAQELWSLLTDPRRMRGWLAAEVSLDVRVGGTIRLRWDTGDVMHGVITVLEPERVLEYTWRVGTQGPESVVRFTVQPQDSGTLLVLEHTRVPADRAAGFGAGWRGHLDALASALAAAFR